MVKKYRKVPVVISAIQWTGANFWQIKYFAGQDAFLSKDGLIIRTLEGDMCASIGDYIIEGIDGEHYPCKPNIFEQTYELVDYDE